MDATHLHAALLRRLLDQPGGVGDAERRHLASCPRCLEELDELDEGHGVVDARPPRVGRSRAALRHPAVVACAVAALLTGAGTAAANDWLPIVRTERLAAAGWSTSDLIGLEDLRAFGDVTVTGEAALRPVTDAAAAAAATGLDVPEVRSLPRGVDGQPAYRVVGAVSATFTYSTARAAVAAAERGASLPPPPPGLDGSRVRLEAGPGWVASWSSSGRPTLVVASSVAPAVSASGVDLDAARGYLLSLPGLPASLAARLRTFGSDGATLPLVVPAELVTTSSAQVDGRPVTVLATRDRTMAAVVWVDDGAMTAVAGPLDVDELLTVARDLR